jgi:hypothetical protein
MMARNLGRKIVYEHDLPRRALHRSEEAPAHRQSHGLVRQGTDFRSQKETTTW